MNLWKYFAGSSMDKDRTYGHSFCAPTEADAKKICERNGWHYDGEIVEVETVPAEEMALFERYITDAEIH